MCGQPRKDDGGPCRQAVPAGATACFWHDPKKQEAARAARRRGADTTNGKRPPKFRTVTPEAAPPPPQTIEDATMWASWAVWAVATGTIDGKTGHEIGYVLRAFLDGRKHLDSVDARVKELAAKIKQLQGAA